MTKTEKEKRRARAQQTASLYMQLITANLDLSRALLACFQAGTQQEHTARTAKLGEAMKATEEATKALFEPIKSELQEATP